MMGCTVHNLTCGIYAVLLLLHHVDDDHLETVLLLFGLISSQLAKERKTDGWMWMKRVEDADTFCRLVE